MDLFPERTVGVKPDASRAELSLRGDGPVLATLRGSLGRSANDVDPAPFAVVRRVLVLVPLLDLVPRASRDDRCRFRAIGFATESGRGGLQVELDDQLDVGGGAGRRPD